MGNLCSGGPKEEKQTQKVNRPAPTSKMPDLKNPKDTFVTPAAAEKPKVEVPKKKKLNKADFMFKGLKDQTLVKLPGDINGIDFMIKD